MPVSCPLASTHRHIGTRVYIHTFSKIFVKYKFKNRRARVLRGRDRCISEFKVSLVYLILGQLGLCRDILSKNQN